MTYIEKIFFTKLCLSVLILIFNFQSWTKADDISEFTIDGISLGESLLDHFSKTDLDNQTRYEYPSKKFFLINLPMYLIDQNSKYDNIQVSLKNKDELYKPYSISGVINFKDNIQECYPLKDKIVKDLSELFQKAKKNNVGTFTMNADPSGESKASTVNFLFESKDFISIQCVDWSDKKIEWWDQLKVSIVTDEYSEFTLSEVYD